MKMTVKERLQNDLKEAMRANDDVRKRTLRMVLAAIRFIEIEKRADLDEESVLSVLRKEIKSRNESITEAEKAGRNDLVESTRLELNVLEAYLPKALDESELERLVKEAIAEAGASTIQHMGQVMKVLMPRLQGRVSGDQASQMVKKLLS